MIQIQFVSYGKNHIGEVRHKAVLKSLVIIHNRFRCNISTLATSVSMAFILC